MLRQITLDVGALLHLIESPLVIKVRVDRSSGRKSGALPVNSWLTKKESANPWLANKGYASVEDRRVNSCNSDDSELEQAGLASFGVLVTIVHWMQYLFYFTFNYEPGAEAMFADLGHFNKGSIQMSFSFLVYPALIVTYAGQGAYLIKNPENISTAFYSSVPGPVFWPVFIVATLAAIVASQALISASFSIIRQSMALGCFPRVNMIHTSNKHEGQVYSPEVNYFHMVACLVIMIGFQGVKRLGMLMVIIFAFLLLFDYMIQFFLQLYLILSIDKCCRLCCHLGYDHNNMPYDRGNACHLEYQIDTYIAVLLILLFLRRSKKTEYEAERKMTSSDLTQLVSNNTLTRVPGICFFCTDLVNGIPPIIRHYVQNVGSLRNIMVIVTVRILPIKSVLPDERFVLGKLGPKGVYRCLIQYGYKDAPNMEGAEFVASVVEKLKEEIEDIDEMTMLESAASKGVVYVLGRTILKSSEKNGWVAHCVIDYSYRFLQKNFRSAISTLKIPPSKMLACSMNFKTGNLVTRKY
ncbi:hypothetical protein GIB67_030011 [Kingdonia uniflora]|uniref:Potassium transporter n=1 Tax=Kingdonia uniflora TaxID=39325 RepID=A0A7J7MXY3_9MAGN|nr:hypothetical protein GIB67_030011 [Kingdonia uniflora]